MEILASHLRIGNFIKLELDNEVYELDHITHGTQLLCWVKPGNEFIKESDLCGVPLTEEWLIKAGFEKVDDADWELNDFNLFSCVTGSTIPHHLHYRGCMLWQSGGSHGPFYLHQLQNLYFALTGQELTLKQPPIPQ